MVIQIVVAERRCSPLPQKRKERKGGVWFAQLVCQYLLGCRDSDLDVPVGELVKKCQCSAELQLQEGALSDYRVLSLDMLNNCLVCLCSLDAAKKEKRSVSPMYPSTFNNNGNNKCDWISTNAVKCFQHRRKGYFCVIKVVENERLIVNKKF